MIFIINRETLYITYKGPFERKHPSQFVINLGIPIYSHNTMKNPKGPHNIKSLVNLQILTRIMKIPPN
jgi:hypothetical protein